MANQNPFECRWGILGTGSAATTFTRELYVDRPEYAAPDIVHRVTAVCDESPDAEGKDPSSFDILYISTLNISHHGQARKALEHRKPVLVEKPACLNAEEWADLMKVAAENGTFLMEAVWTRFLPLPTMLRKRIWEDKVIGDVRAVYSDFGIDFTSNFPDSNRVLDPKLGGGILYDLGGYVIQTALWYMLHHPDNGGEEPTNVKGSMMKYRTGVDILTNVEFEFPRLGAKAFCQSNYLRMGQGLTSLVDTVTVSGTFNTASDAVTRVYGTNGEIAISSTVNCPTRAIIYSGGPGLKFRSHEFESKIELETKLPGFGYYFEADECARCIRDGIIDSPGCRQRETMLTLKVMDRVRRLNGLSYPDEIAAVKPDGSTTL